MISRRSMFTTLFAAVWLGLCGMSAPLADPAPFVFATARYQSGDWDSAPLVPANLIHSLARYTDVPVAPEGVAVDLDSPELFRYPFLFPHRPSSGPLHRGRAAQPEAVRRAGRLSVHRRSQPRHRRCVQQDGYCRAGPYLRGNCTPSDPKRPRAVPCLFPFPRRTAHYQPRAERLGRQPGSRAPLRDRSERPDRSSLFEQRLRFGVELPPAEQALSVDRQHALRGERDGVRADAVMLLIALRGTLLLLLVLAFFLPSAADRPPPSARVVELPTPAASGEGESLFPESLFFGEQPELLVRRSTTPPPVRELNALAALVARSPLLAALPASTPQLEISAPAAPPRGACGGTAVRGSGVGWRFRLGTAQRRDRGARQRPGGDIRRADGGCSAHPPCSSGLAGVDDPGRRSQSDYGGLGRARSRPPDLGCRGAAELGIAVGDSRTGRIRRGVDCGAAARARAGAGRRAPRASDLPHRPGRVRRRGGSSRNRSHSGTARGARRVRSTRRWGALGRGRGGEWR